MEYQTIANPDGTISIVPVNQAQGIMVPAYETSQLDLVDQINQRSRNIGVPMTLEETMAGSVLRPKIERTFQSIFPPQATGIMQQAPLQNLGIDTSYGVANEPDEEQVESLVEQKPSGIAKLFELLRNIPTPFNLAIRGLESLRGLNQRMRDTDFAKSSSLADYFDARSYGGRDARDRAASKTMREARAIQKQVDMRPSSIQTNQDKGRGDRPGGANYSAPSKPSRASSYRDSSSFGKSFHSG
jgi:hypothetical protein